ncbi:MAG TPA: hypothetical protein VLV17_04495 [Anaeromyxobacteraceae bacterium]|nr:hypothetical protein [Anaeromyxobacteraceae bacterium]
MKVRVAALVLLLLASGDLAQDRPAEGDLFGSPSKAEPESRNPESPAPPSPPRPSPRALSEEPGLQGEAGAEARLKSALEKTEDPLKIGGVLYLRGNLSAREQAPPSAWTLSAPSLTDLYLDVRPLDRVRGFVLGRMLFDPTQGSSTSPLPGVNLPISISTQSNPTVLLDQLWLRFDLARTVFLTIGRQHVKWGVGHFWNPTDYLHAVRRDPLATFDERTGTFMAKAHLPWEKRGWNFYGMAIFEPLVTQATSPFQSSAGGSTGPASASGASSTPSELGDLGAGARAEVVVGNFEFGVDGAVQRGIRPRFGVDVSGGIGEVDLRGELGLRTSSDVPLYRGTFVPSQALSSNVSTYEPSGLRPMLVLGADWEHKYSDQSSFTLGLEYFYNSNGYSDASLYPYLVIAPYLTNPPQASGFTPFYLGKHYAGAYLLLPKPGNWNLHTFTLSAIANLSDMSEVARLDWNMTLLTYLRLEAYLQGHFGTSGGEFRFALPAMVFATAVGSVSTPVLGASVADAGLGLRLDL